MKRTHRYAYVEAARFLACCLAVGAALGAAVTGARIAAGR